jgi:hypothetical protein
MRKDPTMVFQGAREKGSNQNNVYIDGLKLQAKHGIELAWTLLFVLFVQLLANSILSLAWWT